MPSPKLTHLKSTKHTVPWHLAAWEEKDGFGTGSGDAIVGVSTCCFGAQTHSAA